MEISSKTKVGPAESTWGVSIDDVEEVVQISTDMLDDISGAGGAQTMQCSMNIGEDGDPIE